jgi:hypothetical protein
MGELIADDGGVLRLTELMAKAPALAPERIDQIAALPLGARLVVDPWSGRAEFVRSAAVPLVSAREKVPFAVTPLMPYIRYAEAPAMAAAPAALEAAAVTSPEVPEPDATKPQATIEAPVETPAPTSAP